MSIGSCIVFCSVVQSVCKHFRIGQLEHLGTLKSCREVLCKQFDIDGDSGKPMMCSACCVLKFRRFQISLMQLKKNTILSKFKILYTAVPPS